jgi:hypothetical protein
MWLTVLEGCISPNVYLDYYLRETTGKIYKRLFVSSGISFLASCILQWIFWKFV